MLLAAITVSTVYGTPAHAQSPGVQKALENVKESLDSLVTAKDEQEPMELPLRIATLKKVIDLSLAEAKDARIKLLELEHLKGEEEAWRVAAASSTKEAVDRFQSQLQSLEEREKTLSVDDVRKAAKEFKAWRDEHYLPALTSIQDYFLINQQDKTIETAHKRWQKIDADVRKLEKAKIKGIKEARELLAAADEAVSASATLNKTARELFFSAYIEKTASTTASFTNATSTAREATSSEAQPMSVNTLTPDATSTGTSTHDEPPAPPSIRTIVKESLAKVRDAYAIYIDMSSLVKKLLK